jgi:leucyl/phenylalanyl-tRNA--protein transferase
MFYKESGASKLALFSLMESLKQKGITWLDTQMVTPVVQSLGGKEIRRSEFLERLQLSLK